jgi:hypothetical protein
MRARDIFLRGWKKWGGRMLNYWREFFFSFCQKNMDGKAGWQIVRDALISMLYVQLVHQFPMLKHGKLAISATNIVRFFFFASSIIVR